MTYHNYNIEVIEVKKREWVILKAVELYTMYIVR